MAKIVQRKLSNGVSMTLEWFTGPKGHRKRHRKSLGFITPAAAEKARLEFELAQLENKPENSTEVPLFEDYVKSYLEWHEFKTRKITHKRVVHAIKNHFLPFFSGKRLDEIKLTDGEAYQKMRKMQRRWPKSETNLALIKIQTVNKETQILKAIFNRAENLNIIVKSPFRLLELLAVSESKEIGYFTEEELELLYRTKNSHWWLLLANTGMRITEARNLKWTHVRGNYIHIESTEFAMTKSGRWRKVPIGDKIRKALLTFWQIESGNPEATTWPEIGGYIFPRLSTNAFSQTAKRAILSVGLEGSAHKFRHTYISLLAMKGTDMKELQLVAGHSKYQTTLNYLHLHPDYLLHLAKHC